MLSYFQRLAFGDLPIEDLTAADFVSLAGDLLVGIQARPTDTELDCPDHYTLKPRQPQTVNGYLVTLGTVIRYGGPISAVEMPARGSKSVRRTRRPTLDELDLLLEHFYSGFRRNPRMVPMHKIVATAIFETHRQGAIIDQSWADYDLENEKMTIRNMKHPSQTKGNDMTLDIRRESRAIIESMPRKAERIFPYNKDLVCRRFTNACKLLGIEDMHFHDFRHDGISRLFEMGLTILQVAQISGHQSWQSLQRYTQIRQHGDKYEGWKWWDVLIAPL